MKKEVRPSVSIAMATYNGETYLREQIQSFLPSLQLCDEIVISDDGSSDNTISMAEDIKYKCQPDIIIVEGPQKGTFRNFENALLHCTKDIIFLCDQDDVWSPNKISKVLNEFCNQNVNVVFHNGHHFNDNGKKEKLFYRYYKGVLPNILRSSYWGCCMAFRRKFIRKYIPFNCFSTAHDQLIGLLGEKTRSVVYLDCDLIAHRQHGSNQTHHLPMLKRFTFRIDLARAYFKVYYGIGGNKP